ncbi:MAG: right-handed parallel beta-helix repeat-containing protein [Kiritimatiellia bacterium]
MVAPRLLQLLKLVGDPEQGETVDWLRFENLEFHHTDWAMPFEEGVDRDTPWHDPDRSVYSNGRGETGSGMLSDMGGIYTLGLQTGTVLRNNHIHHIEALSYGAWCIYPDEGSSHLLIENNVCHSTNREIFHQHYGRENIVRNNIFAFGERGVVS